MTKRALPLLLLALILVLPMWAQRGRRGWQDYRRGTDRGGVPEWAIDQDLPKDVFTFARVRYDSWGRRNKWATDYPESDYNFSYRLQELTAIEVANDPVVVGLTDKELFQYPFLYMIEVGDLSFHDDEVAALRTYLQRGGFLMVDDFWGEEEYENFAFELARVFPDRKLQEIPLNHPIFKGVFSLDKRPQIPSINAALQGRDEGITWEGWDPKEPHYQALYDDNGRMMCIVCHNTDLGDGWEREGENHWYFKEFSEKYAYPLGINIIFYALTQ
ncbi:MAG: DUF4159 domain-containing protein [Verrucomicrobiales bacterium]|nr:DUF4159 domain-containing protein [Verrucomicrobiales bacterium]